MINLSDEQKLSIRDAVMQASENYEGSNADFANILGIHKSVYSRLRQGVINGIMSNSSWLALAREQGVSLKGEEVKIARTSVYNTMEDQFKFCQDYHHSMMLIDDCGIGKTVCAKHIVKRMKNAFYVDCSQAKTKQQFVRAIARAIGVDNSETYNKVIAGIKDYLNFMDSPFIVLDEFGDLEYYSVVVFKELWNATPGCGWFAMGAEGLRRKMENGMHYKKIGYREIFRRFSETFSQYSPDTTHARVDWYKELYTTVAKVNIEEKAVVRSFVDKCVSMMQIEDDNKKRNPKFMASQTNYVPSLTYLDTLIKFHRKAKSAKAA